MKLEFVGDVHYQGKLIYKKGEVQDVSEENGFAYKWIRRGLAIPYVGKPESKQPLENEIKSTDNKTKKKSAKKQVDYGEL